MRITLNGKPFECDERLTVTALLQRSGYHQGSVAVAVNREFLPRDAYDTTVVTPQDEIEVVAPMQGG